MERFFYEVHDVPLFSSRVQALKAKQAFGAQAAHAQQLLETLGGACGAVLLASGFERLLGLVLLVGNKMNAGSPRGGAKGCHLTIMTRLADVKSMQPGTRTTLLQLLVQTAEQQPAAAAVMAWPDELAMATEAARVTWARVTAELSALQRGLALVAQRVDMGALPGPWRTARHLPAWCIPSLGPRPRTPRSAAWAARKLIEAPGARLRPPQG